MRRRGFLVRLVILAAMHLVIACAGFFTPYDPAEQDREMPYAPPARIHWVDAPGRFPLRPYVYPLKLREGSFDEYEPDTTRPAPLRFFVTGARYRLFGLAGSRKHLFDAGGAPIHLLGTDAYGRDLLARTLIGGRISLLTGLLAAALALLVGCGVGSLAGFFGGWQDAILMRLAELFLALPWLYLLFTIRAFLPLAVSPLHAFLLVIAVIGMVGWARPARLVRGVVLSARERDYVRAARGFGAGHFYLLRRHVLPQTTSVLLAQAAILVPQYILAEVTLSFLGLGVPEPVPSWGNLLAALQQYHVMSSCWWMFLPGLAMVPFFLGYMSLASVLQERADPAKI